MSMTDNAANVAVCNQALDLLGADNITVGSGTEQNHIYCTTVFDDARDEILEAHLWNFAKKRAYAVQTTDPIFGWDNAFTKPTDCLKVWKIEQASDAKFEVEASLILTDRGETPSSWVTATAYVAGEYVSNNSISYLCATSHTSGATDDEPGVGATTDTYWIATSGNLDVLQVEYVYQRTDVNAWPVSPRQCLVLNLARMLSSAIKQNEDAAHNLQGMLFGSKKTTGYIDVAKSIDAREGGLQIIRSNTLLNSRNVRTTRGRL